MALSQLATPRLNRVVPIVDAGVNWKIPPLTSYHNIPLINNNHSAVNRVSDVHKVNIKQESEDCVTGQRSITIL